jgi:hypothetical protein
MKTRALLAGTLACALFAMPVAAGQPNSSPRTLQPIATSGELLISQSGPRLDGYESISDRAGVESDGTALVAAVLRNNTSKAMDCRAASGFNTASCHMLAAPSAAYW